MKLYYQLVSVQDIQSSLSASQFPTEEIEQAANLFLEAELTIQPVVLRQNSLESYAVIYGDFVYFAAVRAREINPRKAETIQAVVLDSENESALLKQVELLKKDIGSSTSSNDIAGRFNNFEETINQRITDLIKTVNQENKELKSSMKAIQEQIPKRHNLLDIFNLYSQEEIKKFLLEKTNINNGNINRYQIVNQIFSKRPFNSLEEIPKVVKGLSETAMLKLIENWINTIKI